MQADRHRIERMRSSKTRGLHAIDFTNFNRPDAADRPNPTRSTPGALIVRTSTRGLPIFLACILCLIANDASAQNKNAKNKSGFQDLFGSDPKNCPTCHIVDLDRLRIRCEARATAYQNQGCDRSCTSECKRIGTSLNECDPPGPVTCVQ